MVETHGDCHRESDLPAEKNGMWPIHAKLEDYTVQEVADPEWSFRKQCISAIICALEMKVSKVEIVAI